MPLPPIAPPRSGLVWPHLALAGIAAFVLAAGALHLLRPDLDPVAHPMSLYLVGAWGAWLQAAYVALGLAMAGLGWGLYRTLGADARSAAPVLLFALAGASLATTAYASMDLPGVDPGVEGLVHGISAQAAFLFATTGLVLQALRFRHDAAWRRHVRWLLPWALACFAAVWVLALWRDLPRGLAQKTVIAMIVGWLLAVALLLRARLRLASRAS
ncbi:DUF998 domain-containing protein [Luteimonas kalidii]|uniref:DUF998 domain-containing protein n=1 Tax=Luteimonas kalidii TaxID=3042025 RepID=A0ABT6JWP6_9GAMM|nr:DUF998 domain-containing protein [Luteimonas kalidii]MDH5835114.1 DUF998 domain-containing protein [Luteimonas kalidii]